MSTATAGPEYLTLKEAAGVLRVSAKHAERMARRGQLPAVKVGRCVRVPAAALRPESLPPHTPEHPCPPSPSP